MNKTKIISIVLIIVFILTISTLGIYRHIRLRQFNNQQFIPLSQYDEAVDQLIESERDNQVVNETH